MADEVRLIDANDYRKRRCRTCINRVQCDNGGNLCFDIMVLNTCPTIEAQPVNGWISVTDEMPKLGQRVMAFCRAGILTFLRYDGEVWFEMSSRNEYLLSFVTHWQPLPEPPKGE